MSAIWHDYGRPSFLAAGPQFSFLDVAQVVEIAPQPYEAARHDLERRESLFGAAYYEHQAARAWDEWQRKRPWWL